MGGFKKTMTVPPKKDHKKVYGVHMPSTRFKPTESMTIENEDLQEFSTEIPKPNEQFSGLNFSRASFEEDEYEAVFNKIFKKHAQLEPIEEENKTKASNRVSMKAYGFDDDDDPYTGGQSRFLHLKFDLKI